MGKLMKMAKDDFGAEVIGFEPGPVIVCNGWRLFPDIELHVGDASSVRCLPTAIADMVVTVGVLAYYDTIEYLCRSTKEQLELLKPGGSIIHAWLVVIFCSHCYYRHSLTNITSGC